LVIDWELIIISTLLTVVLGFLSCNGFYYAFKKYERNEEDNFTAIDFDSTASFPIFLGALFIIFDVILWISKAIFPNRVHLAVVRIVAFLIGVIFLLPIFILWLIVLKL